MILNLVLSLKNNIHLDFYGKKILVSPFSNRYHNSLLKRMVHGAFKACNKKYIKIQRSNPEFLPSGKKFPTLKTIYDESLGDNSHNSDVPRLILWQTSEIKQSALSEEFLISISTQLDALPTHIASPKS